MHEHGPGQPRRGGRVRWPISRPTPRGSRECATHGWRGSRPAASDGRSRSRGKQAGRVGRAPGRVRTRRTVAAEDLRRDRDALDLVSFNLMLAVQACADVASHMIADEGWAPATSLGASFERLQDHGVISGPVCEALVRAVGLRNVIAHGYAGVRPEMVHAAATTGWPTWRRSRGRSRPGRGDNADSQEVGCRPRSSRSTGCTAPTALARRRQRETRGAGRRSLGSNLHGCVKVQLARRSQSDRRRPRRGGRMPSTRMPWCHCGAPIHQAESVVFRPPPRRPGRSGTEAPQSLSGSLLTRTRY